MKQGAATIFKILTIGLLGGLGLLCCAKPGIHRPSPPPPSLEPLTGNSARLVGSIQNPHLCECSGMDASPGQKGLLWALNDSGNEACVFAMETDGRNLGQVNLCQAVNRDWEGIDAFIWKGEAYLLVADIGDNKQQHSVHRLYILHEPKINDSPSPEAIKANMAWHIDFTYPDGNHDAECAAVDVKTGSVLVITKRDLLPIVFEIPLEPPNGSLPVTATLLTRMTCIPAPSPEDLSKPYGKLSSQPTAMDISADGHRLVILTYKHAYLFIRQANQTWEEALARLPQRLELPSPYQHPKFNQREAVCFSADGRSIFIASEGIGAKIYQLELNR